MRFSKLSDTFRMSNLTCTTARLGPLNLRGIAARGRKVDVQIGRLRIRKQALDGRLDFTAVDQFASGHHGFDVEGTNREWARPQLLGNLVDRAISRIALADIDGEAHAIGRIHPMVLVVD